MEADISSELNERSSLAQSRVSMCEVQSCEGSWTDCEGSELHMLATLLVDYAEEPAVLVLADQDLAEVADLTDDASGTN